MTRHEYLARNHRPCLDQRRESAGRRRPRRALGPRHQDRRTTWLGSGAAVLRDWLTRAGLTLENKRTFARDGAVVVEQHGVWRSVDTSEFKGEADVASRFEVVDGKVATFERYDDLRAALAAAELEESDVTEAV